MTEATATQATAATTAAPAPTGDADSMLLDALRDAGVAEDRLATLAADEEPAAEGEATTTEATKEAPAATEAPAAEATPPAEDDERSLRQRRLKESIAAAELRNAERKARLKATQDHEASQQRQQELERRQQSLQSTERDIDEAAKALARAPHDPAALLAFMKAKGIPVDGAYRAMTQELLQKDSPEAKQAAQFRELLGEELKPIAEKAQKYDSVQQELAETRAAMQQMQTYLARAETEKVEREFLSVAASDPATRDLASLYDSEEDLVEDAHREAEKLLAKKKYVSRKNLFTEVAKNLHERHTARYQKLHGVFGKAASAPADASEKTAAKPTGGGAHDSQAARPISAQASSTVTTSGKRPLTEEERDAEAAELIAKALGH